jgi:hypothetical protein
MRVCALAPVMMLVVVLCAASFVRAETLVADFSADRWEINAKAAKFESYKGKDALFLDNGFAILKGANFENGILEFDMAIPDTRGFFGIFFRMQDTKNAEEFYLRAHQSGNPDANQYSPVFNGIAGWQLYYGPGFSAPVKYRFNEWMPIKILVQGDEAEVYIDNTTPSLFITDLKRDQQKGGIALRSNFAGAHFANLRITPKESVVFQTPIDKRTAARDIVPPGSLVKAWAVSTPFAGDLLKEKMSLPADFAKGLQWRDLPSEPNGLTNLARLAGISPTANTVFAALVLKAERTMPVPLRFGFSDEARVFLNGALLFEGKDQYASRDYRFLGTIGLYDTLILSLKKGENRLWIAVTENQAGGWGVLADIAPQDGLSVRAGHE